MKYDGLTLSADIDRIFFFIKQEKDMGFFDFIADAGTNLFKDDDPEPQITKPIAVQIKDAGVLIDNLKVKFMQGVVTLSGYLPDQDQKEKAVLVAGNINGVSSVQDNVILGTPPADTVQQEAEEVKAAQEASNTEPSFRTYTVKSGDTLGKISKEMYGKSSLYNKIFEANTPMLKDANSIYPGQVLKIPE
ncbi:MAG: peptidoglycan-binding protein LysM [Proteobacteria bacterium]|nr:peptidoglycan-binding protein LysM [Pseudomonadota bacterium]